MTRLARALVTAGRFSPGAVHVASVDGMASVDHLANLARQACRLPWW